MTKHVADSRLIEAADFSAKVEALIDESRFGHPSKVALHMNVGPHASFFARLSADKCRELGEALVAMASISISHDDQRNTRRHARRIEFAGPVRVDQ